MRRVYRSRQEYKTTETRLSLSVDGFYALRTFFIGIWALRLILSYGLIAISLIVLLSWTSVLIVQRLYSIIILSCTPVFLACRLCKSLRLWAPTRCIKLSRSTVNETLAIKSIRPYSSLLLKDPCHLYYSPIFRLDPLHLL